MPSNYVLLRKTTLTTSAASVTFSSIPQTGYTDLKIVTSTRDSDNPGYGWGDVRLTFNGLSTNRTQLGLYGTGSSSTSFTATSIFGRANNSYSSANIFGLVEMYIPNYLSSNDKTVSIFSVSENNSTAAIMDIGSGRWASSAAVNEITLTAQGSFLANSEFSLYGIAAVGVTPDAAPYATGGDSVTNDGTYWIHTFLSSGTFTPAKALTCDYLVVAGGGSGGSKGEYGAGGGAGGLRSTVTATGGGGTLESALSVTATPYQITVGAGAPGKTTAGTGIQGSNSIFATITSIGGGGGGGWTRSPDTAQAPTTGGSGGAGDMKVSAIAGTNVGAAGTANQGFAGGNGNTGGGNYAKGGGGGGAGAIGENGYTPGNAATTYTVASPASPSGNGGVGVAVAITGSSVYYAGGGAGGSYYTSITSTGGTGGGGNGGNSTTNGSNATANTGGGGGGSGSTSTGAGGSGIVIVRYPMV